ncbi:MAG TPA: M28 family metallopeptidase [Gemmatimonadaceae bacterium]|nr:M28 family metallopeptidase [Gemmatimonadaceae bacterium]
MRLASLLAVAAFLGIPALPVHSAPPSRLTGFSAPSERVERGWEAKFKAIPSPDSQRAYMRHLTARPHHVGSPYDSANAQWILAHFKSWGLDAHIERFEVLFPTPRERLVELIAPSHFKASLEEPTVPGDPTSAQHAEQLPTYNAYSIDGDVTAPLVYVNYGLPSDYDELARHGVSVKGAIVIARYGNSWRGVKPMVAAEHGAVGCIIYSDPADDGYGQGDTYPKGPYRPKDGVQRGSVMEMQLYPGDPLTPGVGATHDAKRLALADAPTITKIPVLPISYGDAQPLLAALGGPVVPEPWRGGLGITYHMGAGPARVHLVVKSNWDLKPVYDVIATIRGASEPDEWVIRGNHQDAWVNGAEDPTAGQVALMEEARALGTLLGEGWKPRRTIIYAAWDGEEPMLLGSTEWVEEHADELRQKAVAYLNSDTNDRGYLFAGGTPSLARFVSDVAKDVDDPETHLSVYTRRQLADIKNARSDDARQRERTSGVLRVGPLGSGSDYSGFVDHLGIASLNIGFGGESDGSGVYHSVYDDFNWYTHFSDTSFVYGRALSQMGGLAVMRLADADVLPYDFTGLASTVQGYVSDLEHVLQSEHDETAEQNREIQEGVFAATSDPWHPTIAPAVESLPPHLGFADLENGADSLTRSAGRWAEAFAALEADTAYRADPAVNALLVQAARRLTDKRGLPGRPWYTFELEAPGFYTGYGAKTMPAVREAIEQRKFPLAQQQITIVGAVLGSEAALIDSAAVMLGHAPR